MIRQGVARQSCAGVSHRLRIPSTRKQGGALSVFVGPGGRQFESRDKHCESLHSVSVNVKQKYILDHISTVTRWFD